MLLGTVQLFAPLLLFLLLGVVEPGNDFARMTTGVSAVGALGDFSLRSLLTAVAGENVLVMTTQSVVVHRFVVRVEGIERSHWRLNGRLGDTNG